MQKSLTTERTEKMMRGTEGIFKKNLCGSQINLCELRGLNSFCIYNGLKGAKW